MTKQEMFDLLFRYADKDKLCKENNISLKEFGEASSQIEIGFEILSILKEKEVNLFIFNSIVESCEEYNGYTLDPKRHLTQEEYNLIRSWLVEL